MATAPFHENIVSALNELGKTLSPEAFAGCVRTIVGTKLPKNHDAIEEAVRRGADVLCIARHRFVQQALAHIEAERPTTEMIQVGKNDMAHAG